MFLVEIGDYSATRCQKFFSRLRNTLYNIQFSNLAFLYLFENHFFGIARPTDSANYYKSWSGYNDEILLAAVWIAKASQKLEPEAFLKDLGTDCRRGKIVWISNDYENLLIWIRKRGEALSEVPI